MHVKRWITGLIAAPILVYVIGFAPRWLFCALLLAASLAGLSEFYQMTSKDQPRPLRAAMYLLTVLLFGTFYTRQVLIAPVVILLWAVVPMAYYMLGRPAPGERWTAEMGKSLLGPTYIVLPLALLWLIDLQPKGTLWIFFLLLVIFANDTGAFYSGRFFGRHKLYEAISPGKTWEGAIGGGLSSILAAFLFLRVLALHPFDLAILILVGALAAAGQIGDLAESMLKRNHGVKDSGKMLPGHGGILDRMDSLLFSIPVLYVYLYGAVSQ